MSFLHGWLLLRARTSSVCGVLDFQDPDMPYSDADALLTVIVATCDQPEILRRHLKYLVSCRFPFRVVVADCSSPELAHQNRTAVATTRRIKLHYGYSEAGHLEVCRNVLKRVATPYAAVLEDGDFGFSSTLHQAVTFLQEHPNFGSAIGLTASDLVRKGRCYILPARSIVNDSPVVRFRALARNWFSTLAGVHRTKLLYETYRNTATCTDFQSGRRLSEILLSQMAVLQSRVHVIPRICCLQKDRELAVMSDDAESTQARRRGAVWNLRPAIVSPGATSSSDEYAELFRLFRENLVGQLEAAGATRDHAELMLEQLYGHLVSEAAPIVARKRPGMFGKLQRESVRHFGQLVNLVRSDRILQRRLLRHADLLGLDNEWMEARQLLAMYPHGVHEDDRSAAAA